MTCIRSTVKACNKEAGLVFTGIASVTSQENNNSTSCEYESIKNLKLCMHVELRKKWQLLTVACIVKAG